ncbi:MAG: twin-arginine translocase TatA/TatE family subunit [Hyphomicrobiaceae bacterium]|nr:twin-arginine translocase TatA/TatE family subunit [Hyphomicrobiaceae bacterium]
MGATSIWHWLILLVIVLIFFGRGKIPELMGDVAKGIRSFKKGMADDEDTAKPADKAIGQGGQLAADKTDAEQRSKAG